MSSHKWQLYAQRGRGGRGRGYGFGHSDNKFSGGSGGVQEGGFSDRSFTIENGHADPMPHLAHGRNESREMYPPRPLCEDEKSLSSNSQGELRGSEPSIPSRGQKRNCESTELFHLVQSMNGGNYGQLKSLTGRSFFLPFSILPASIFSSSNVPNEHKIVNPGIAITFIQVQSDPFAPGSVVEVEFRLPFNVAPLIYLPFTEEESSNGKVAHAADQGSPFALNHREEDIRLIAGEDFLLRTWKAHLFAGVEEEEDSSDEQQGTGSGGGETNYRSSYGREGRRGRAVEVIRISPHVIPRSAAQLDPGSSLVRFYFRVKLPGHGRRIDGSGICRILREDVVRSTAQLWSFLQCSTGVKSMHSISYACVGRDHLGILHPAESGKALMLHYIDHLHDQEWLRCQLMENNLAAFVVNDAILPRAAGNSDKPMNREECVTFKSPPSMEFSFLLPRTQRRIAGMGLPRAGLTLIAGGGFHGKSTLLRGLELGIYNHIPSDGRAFVVTNATAVKIRAEDRRSVHGVNIETFISNLPFGKDTSHFITSEASGSTSQAANIMEALELGAHTLLLDEDTSATNLMYRDDLVQSLVPSKDEPITSLVERIPVLLKEKEVSVILVVGGSGQYFQHADRVIVMKNYLARDSTAEAKEIAQRQHHFSSSAKPAYELDTAASGTASSSSTTTTVLPFAVSPIRHLDPSRTFGPLSASGRSLYRGGRGRGAGGRHISFPSSADGARNDRIKVGASSAQRIRCADEEIDLSLVEQLVEEGQLQAIAQCIALCYDKGNKWVDEVQTNNNGSQSRSSDPVKEKPVLCLYGDGFPPLLPQSPPSLLPLSLASSLSSVSFPLGPPSHFSRLVWSCEWSLRRAHLELQTPSAYIPRGFTSLPRVMEIGAALNRLRTLYTKPL